MDRRRFLQSLGLASAGGIVAYSFPKIIVHKNIEAVTNLGEIFLTLPNNLKVRISDSPQYGFGFYGKPIDYEAMVKAYERACQGSAEQSCIYIKSGFIYNV